MTLYELWKVTPQNHIFVKANDSLMEYTGGKMFRYSQVKDVNAVKYPSQGIVLEVKLA